jgi:stage V sporulation protein B
MKNHSFFKGVVLLSAAGIIVKFSGFIYRVILTNLPGYGDEGNGIYGAGFQVYLIFYALSTTGFPAAISRLVAKKRALGNIYDAHRVFKTAFVLLIISGFTLSVLFFIFSKSISHLISNERTLYTMMALSPSIFFVSIMSAYRGYFQGMLDMSPQAFSQIIEQFIKMAATTIFAVVLLPYGVEMAAAGATFGTTVGTAAGALFLFILYNKRKRGLWKEIKYYDRLKIKEPTSSIIKDLLKVSIPVSLGALALTSANIVDLYSVVLLLEKAGFSIKNANQLYGILTGKCYVFTNLPVTIVMALSTSLIPAVSGIFATGNIKAAEEKIKLSIMITILICLPVSFGLSALSKPILTMIFPKSAAGSELLALSSIAIVFMGLTQTLSGILQGINKAYVAAAGILAGALIKLIINFTLIPVPSINIKGAVFGTIACYITSTLINIIALNKNIRLKIIPLNLIIKPVVISALTGIWAYCSYELMTGITDNNMYSVAISVFTSIPIYGLLVILSGCMDIKKIFLYLPGRRIRRMSGGGKKTGR